MLRITIDELKAQSIEVLKRSKTDDGKIYDPTYDTYFDFGDAVKMLDIAFEEMEKSGIEDMDFAAVSTDNVKESFEASKNTINRYLEEGFISQQMYDEAITNLNESVKAFGLAA